MIFLPTIINIKRSSTDNKSISNEKKASLTTLARYEIWRILYKLSLSTIIVHYLVVFWFYASNNTNGLLLGKWVTLRAQYGSLVLSFSIGLIFYLLIDKPLRNFDRLVLFPTKLSDSFLIKKNNKQTALAVASINTSAGMVITE